MNSMIELGGVLLPKSNLDQFAMSPSSSTSRSNGKAQVSAPRSFCKDCFLVRVNMNARPALAYSNFVQTSQYVCKALISVMQCLFASF